MRKMKKRAAALLMALTWVILPACPVYAQNIAREETPDYKVAFYAFDCYHMQDENGKRYEYGYEMMENLSSISVTIMQGQRTAASPRQKAQDSVCPL